MEARWMGVEIFPLFLVFIFQIVSYFSTCIFILAFKDLIQKLTQDVKTCLESCLEHQDKAGAATRFVQNFDHLDFTHPIILKWKY